MLAGRFELIVLIHNRENDFHSIAELKSAAAFSWGSREGDFCAVFPTFPDMPQKTLETLAEVVRWPEACVKIGGRLVNDRAKFGIAIRCYLESLRGNGLEKQTAGQSVKRWTQPWRTKHHYFLSCHIPSCSCVHSPQLVKPSKNWPEIAALNEVEWCPYLGFPTAQPAVRHEASRE